MILVTIEEAENGYIVIGNGGPGAMAPRWVFSTEKDLGDWITENVKHKEEKQ